VLRSGRSGPDDPQFAVALAFPPVADVGLVADGETLTVGPIALTAQFTAGHTPGGTSWSWRSCDGPACLAFVYADSQTPVSADDFLFTRSDAYPTALADFERGFERLESLPCDVLVTPHPGASNMWERFAPRGATGPRARPEPDGCRLYAAAARARLARRIALENGRP
jgi:metallo-beta-lactamase class B